MRTCVVCGATIGGKKVKYCSNACKQRDHYHRLQSQSNTYHSQTMRSLKRKLMLIEYLGGACSACGYNANIAALNFHHIDSSLKTMKLDCRALSNTRWDRIIEEAGKCQLLCANCHAEEHNPESALKNVQRIVAGASRKELRDEQGVNSGKP